MLNEQENSYFERWTYMQKNQQFQKRIILSLLGVIGLLLLVVLFVGQETPLVIERDNSAYRSLAVEKSDLKPTKESVAQLISEFIEARYEWESFEPQVIVKKLEPYTTEALRAKLLEEFGKKGFQNKPGDSVEQSVARIRPIVSDQAVLATFDRVLRINGIPVVVPTEISLLLSEGAKTFFNPVGLYINGVIEHENK
ncbi:MAG: hypothetical protein JNL11_01500 [Bdellovibrionaceae bacterium]|nr:hypothetical protein [Pseudobdellovibrionaceae bacterium]